MPLTAILGAKAHCRRQSGNSIGLWAGHCPAPTENCKFSVIPRAVRPVGIRSLAPRVYEGGGPKGRGEKRSILPNSPSHDFRRASPLLKAGAEGAVQTGGSYQEIATSLRSSQ